MKRIGLLSDTHGYIDEKIINFFDNCDEIWHAGDIGSLSVADKLAGLKTFRAVHGNIDGHDIRVQYGKHLRFLCEEVNVWITHIGGYPGHYERTVKEELTLNTPQLFICGHSHILKVIYDKKFRMLHINPGAAGINGFHKFRTAVRFIIDRKAIRQLEVFEIDRNRC